MTWEHRVVKHTEKPKGLDRDVVYFDIGDLRDDWLRLVMDNCRRISHLCQDLRGHLKKGNTARCEKIISRISSTACVRLLSPRYERPRHGFYRWDVDLLTSSFVAVCSVDGKRPMMERVKVRLLDAIRARVEYDNAL